MNGKRRPKVPCCGPYAQKQKRLTELDAAVRRLLKNVDARPKAQVSLEKALAERRLLAGWLAAHACVPPLPRSGRATRFFPGAKEEPGPENADSA